MVVKKQGKVSVEHCNYYWLVGKENVIAAWVPAAPVLADLWRKNGSALLPTRNILSHIPRLILAFTELHYTHDLHSSWDCLI